MESELKSLQITAEEMMEDPREKYMIDLRKPEDFARESCEEAVNIYWEEFDGRLQELPKDKPVYLICYTGETSDEYAGILRRSGFEAYSVREGWRGYMRWKLKKAMEAETTRRGNPRKPQGQDGADMLRRMNGSHAKVTGWALGFLDFQENDQVLDIGCGGGATLHRISEYIGTGHLTGVDYSEVSVQVSRETNAADIQKGRMHILEASVEAFPFGDETFDKIVTVESFYFWPDPAENLKEVLRVLKKGGVFLLVADIYQKEGLSEKVLESIRQYQLYNPTEEKFRELFTQAGFTSVEIHTKSGEDWICVSGQR